MESKNIQEEGLEDENSVITVKKKGISTAHKIDSTILELCWSLAEGDDSKRVNAADFLTQKLREIKTKVRYHRMTCNVLIRYLIQILISNFFFYLTF